MPVTDENQTVVTQFILVGLSDHPQAQLVLFWLLLGVYFLTLLGNGLMIMVIIADSHLHTPMYFFLSNLSLIDIFYTTSSIPQILANSFTYRASIPVPNCLTQMYSGLFFGMTECLLLAVMAYDRFAAVCHPLHYTLIMSNRLCTCLVAASWIIAFLLTVIPIYFMPVSFCGPNLINHFSCEAQAVYTLACSNVRINEIFTIARAIPILVVPFVFIMATYIRIGLAVLRIRSAEAQSKAFSTCGSHLIVVGIFYGSAMSAYLRPHGKSSSDQDKLISLLYGTLTPMLNPIIYSLRNKDVKGAIYRVIKKKLPE
ncbi:olfactory receptor 13H1-like [Eublepharis macularius]|uniref:Olfactory receptor n=1 Tax=Eublepharis macularius TaxID=481883 RepID=A0AA97LLE4_EUBMA|nr:olfactory receptor 13H1-like [Eublepharis macularius]